MSEASEIPGVAADALAGWLRAEGLISAQAPEPRLTRLTGGSSNLTVRVECEGHDWVLRRPPVRGGVGNAHDMLREYRIQQALGMAAATQQRGLAVPRMVAACADEGVLGASFYLMQRIEGFVHSPASLRALPDEQAHAAGLALADALADLHAIDTSTAAAFDEFRRPEAYADRQLRRWHTQWLKTREATGLPDEPAVDRVFEWLTAHRPPGTEPRIVHGDYGFANVMFDRGDPTRVQAVLDWELTSLGDPLADLGILCAYFGEAGRIIDSAADSPLCHPSKIPALPNSAELVEAYAVAAPSAPVEHVDWYTTLATIRLAVIVAGAVIRLPPTNAAGQERRPIVIAQLSALAAAAEASTGA